MKHSFSTGHVNLPSSPYTQGFPDRLGRKTINSLKPKEDKILTKTIDHTADEITKIIENGENIVTDAFGTRYEIDHIKQGKSHEDIKNIVQILSTTSGKEEIEKKGYVLFTSKGPLHSTVLIEQDEYKEITNICHAIIEITENTSIDRYYDYAARALLNKSVLLGNKNIYEKLLAQGKEEAKTLKLWGVEGIYSSDSIGRRNSIENTILTGIPFTYGIDAFFRTGTLGECPLLSEGIEKNGDKNEHFVASIFMHILASDKLDYKNFAQDNFQFILKDQQKRSKLVSELNNLYKKVKRAHWLQNNTFEKKSIETYKPVPSILELNIEKFDQIDNFFEYSPEDRSKIVGMLLKEEDALLLHPNVDGTIEAMLIIEPYLVFPFIAKHFPEKIAQAQEYITIIEEQKLLSNTKKTDAYKTAVENLKIKATNQKNEKSNFQEYKLENTLQNDLSLLSQEECEKVFFEKHKHIVQLMKENKGKKDDIYKYIFSTILVKDFKHKAAHSLHNEEKNFYIQKQENINDEVNNIIDYLFAQSSPSPIVSSIDTLIDIVENKKNFSETLDSLMKNYSLEEVNGFLITHWSEEIYDIGNQIMNEKVPFNSNLQHFFKFIAQKKYPFVSTYAYTLVDFIKQEWTIDEIPSHFRWFDNIEITQYFADTIIEKYKKVLTDFISSHNGISENYDFPKIKTSWTYIEKNLLGFISEQDKKYIDEKILYYNTVVSNVKKVKKNVSDNVIIKEKAPLLNNDETIVTEFMNNSIINIISPNVHLEKNLKSITNPKTKKIVRETINKLSELNGRIMNLSPAPYTLQLQSEMKKLYSLQLNASVDMLSKNIREFELLNWQGNTLHKQPVLTLLTELRKNISSFHV